MTKSYTTTMLLPIQQVELAIVYKLNEDRPALINLKYLRKLLASHRLRHK